MATERGRGLSTDRSSSTPRLCQKVLWQPRTQLGVRFPPEHVGGPLSLLQEVFVLPRNLQPRDVGDQSFEQQRSRFGPCAFLASPGVNLLAHRLAPLFVEAATEAVDKCPVYSMCPGSVLNGEEGFCY